VYTKIFNNYYLFLEEKLNENKTTTTTTTTKMIHLNRIIIITGTGCLLIFISAILYLVLGITVVQRYGDEANFKKTTCTVRDVEIHEMNSKEDWYKCPWKCSINHTPDGLKTACEISEFPCLRIVVDVSTPDGLRSAILHEDPDKMAKYGDCSTFHCNQDSVVNEKVVNHFKRNYGVVDQKYNCFYNIDSLNSDDYDDDGQEHALLKLTYSEAAFVNSLFWPSLLFIIGVVLVGYGLYNIDLERRAAKIRKRLMTDL
jgi:hypothetical protein